VVWITGKTKKNVGEKDGGWTVLNWVAPSSTQLTAVGRAPTNNTCKKKSSWKGPLGITTAIATSNAPVWQKNVDKGKFVSVDAGSRQ